MLIIFGLFLAADPQAVLIRTGGETIVEGRSLQKSATNSVKRINLDFKDAEIHNVIRLFAAVSGKNFVVSDGVKGTVTVFMKDVPWDQALAAILASKGLAAQNMGGVVLVRGQ